jgi:osmotically-inducible protein OsmY
MSGWMIVAIVAIVMSGIVRIYKMRHDERRGIVRDEDDRPVQFPRDDPAAQREIEDLRERIKVLERIATDGNTLDASETQRIAREIEDLRDR